MGRYTAATGAEAGYVASGAAACLLLAAAACVAGLDPSRMARLPDTRRLKNEIVMVRSQRNFYDHAVRAAELDVTNAKLVRLLRAKLTVPGTGAVNVSPERLRELRQQVDAQLRPVLRPREFEQFDVDRAFGIVRGVAQGLE